MDIRLSIQNLKPERLIVLAAAALGAMTAFGLTIILGMKMTNIPGFALFILSYGLAAFMGGCSVIFISAAVVRSNHFPKFALMHLIQGLCAVALMTLQLLIALHPLSIEFTYLLAGCTLLIWLLATMNLLTSCLNKNDDRLTHAAISAVGIILIFVGYQGLGFLGLEESFLSTWRNLSVLLAAHPLCVGIHAYLKEGHQKESFSIKTFRDAWMGQFHELNKFLYAMQISTVLAQAFFIAILLQVIPPATEQWIGSNAIWTGIFCTVVPGFFWSYFLWRSSGQLSGRDKASSRSSHDRTSWVGLKTAVLLIEHDPHEECRIHLPALLYRARQLQCEQLIQKTFEQQILSQTSTGSQIILALDPRSIASPCVQALLIVTVLYLDGLSVVESRLKNLVRLFPLLDPEMAHSLNAVQLESLFSRLQGFFHLDHSWIDQSRDDANAQMDIRLEHLNPRQRQRVLSQLSNSQWLGNFIWISDAAREQLKIESPYLASTIERLPIRLEQSQGKILETTIFLVKFENLIPRLQRYYALDEIRTKLAPLPIPTMNVGVLQGLEDELGQAIDANAVNAILNEIQLADWVGFQAKDRALDLILRCIQRAENLEKRGQLPQEDLIKLRVKARDAVQEVGYPSQDFHLNHLQKLEIRQLHELKRICIDARHPRFEEAWLLLSSLPSRFMDPETAQQLLTLIRNACVAGELKNRPFVLQKALEGFFALARVVSDAQGEMTSLLNLLAKTLVEASVNETLILSFLDRKLALDQTRGMVVPLQDDVMRSWSALINTLLNNNKISASMRQAIELRWLSFQTVPKAEAS